jgi:hypothetical protein
LARSSSSRPPRSEARCQAMVIDRFLSYVFFRTVRHCDRNVGQRRQSSVDRLGMGYHGRWVFE